MRANIMQDEARGQRKPAVTARRNHGSLCGTSLSHGRLCVRIKKEKSMRQEAGETVRFNEQAEEQALDATRHGEATKEFQDFLRARIVGQEAAVEAVTELYQIFLAGMAPPDRPIGNLLFLGPTGSGKTYVVEVVAEALFGDPHSFIKVNCAEFQEHHEIAKLIGSPPGYIGHGQTPALLTQAALNQWHTEKLKLSLVLFDEIEKASEALWQLLLGILDKASLTLGDNSHVDLSQCLIFMTSNLGAAQMSTLVEGGIPGVACRRSGRTL